MAEMERNTHKVYEKDRIGEVQIADEVVAIIAGLAATDSIFFIYLMGISFHLCHGTLPPVSLKFVSSLIISQTNRLCIAIILFFQI